MALVGGLDGLDIFADGGIEVRPGVMSAERGQEAHHIVGDPAFVESGPALGGDLFQGLGQQRQPDLVAQPVGLAVLEVMFGGGRVPGEDFLVPCPVEGDPVIDREAVAGITDGRLQHIAQGHGAVIGRELRPGVHRARHRHRVGALAGQFVDTGFRIPIRGGSGRRPARTVERNDALAVRGIKAETVTADTGGLRLHDALDRHRGDGRVHGVAAGLQNLNGRHGRERL